MKIHHKKCCALYLLGLVWLASTPGVLKASNFSLEGSFKLDDDVQLFDMVTSTAGAVDIRTYSYAGGLTSTGRVVPSGGFDPVLTLFNSAGIFLADNDDGSGVATDPATGYAFDARITTNLPAGSYIVALTEYDNFAAGNLADGFVEAGNPQFTSNPTFTTGAPCPGNLFRDGSATAGRCRNGNWAVDFMDVGSVIARSPSSVPEPNGTVLLGLGLIWVGILLRRRRFLRGILLFKLRFELRFGIAAFRVRHPDGSIRKRTNGEHWRINGREFSAPVKIALPGETSRAAPGTG